MADQPYRCDCFDGIYEVCPEDTCTCPHHDEDDMVVVIPHPPDTLVSHPPTERTLHPMYNYWDAYDNVMAARYGEATPNYGPFDEATYGSDPDGEDDE